jgi:thioredoxin-like negative regulator of GroEL
MPRSTPTRLLVAAAALVLAACSKPADPPPAAPPATAAKAAGIAWTYAASDEDVDAAFARARAAGKPVFVYWGAKWCPPCNQLQATLFPRADFIERSRSFVPVYVDGDRPGAQKLGARFKVRGYPTMVLFDKNGNELTRLPGEVEASQYTQVLTLGINAQRPVRAVLAAARDDAGKGLSADDWRMLAFYSWETDEQQLVPKEGLGALLWLLAERCPPAEAETRMRLLLKALATEGARPASLAQAALREQVLELLADEPRSRSHMDVLSASAPEIVRALSADDTPERALLGQAFDAAMHRFELDTSLSRADRVGATIGRVMLAKVGASPENKTPKLAEALLADVRATAQRVDREVTDPYERQAVIGSAAYLLEQAGLLDESDALLQASLARSHSPYYLMSALASNAKRRGDNETALRWYQEAFDKSEGPATRLQWGASYVNALVDLAPADAQRIERTVERILGEAAAMPDAFHERSGRSMQRIGGKLQAWNKTGARSDELKRLQTRIDALCAKLPMGEPQRAVCEGLLKGAPPAAG